MTTLRSLQCTWLAAALGLGACAGTSERQPREKPAAVELSPGERAEDEINAWAACRQPAKRKEILLDKTRRRLHQTVCGAALWFDGLFGERDLDAALESYGRVEVSASYSEFEGADTRVRFDARVRLPALEERLSVFVGRDDEDDFVRDRSEGQALRSQARRTDRDEFLLGLGFANVTTERFQSDFRIGARNVRLPKVFVQNRFSYVPHSDPRHRVYLRATPFWNNRDRAGITVSTDFDQVIEQAFLLRWGSIGTITEESAGLDWRSALILYQNLRGSSALAYETFIRGLTEAPEPLVEYGLRTVYREPFLENRLICELALGYSWPRFDPALERDGSAGIGFGVEMPFGAVPD